MEELRNIFSEREILSITNFVATDSTISALIKYLKSGKYNPIEKSYFNDLLPRLMSLTPLQVKVLESYSREINSPNFIENK